MITLKETKEKSPIFILQHWKNSKFDSTIIISHFACTNDICVDCNSIVLHIREKGITTLKIYHTMIETTFEILRTRKTMTLFK